MKLKIIGIVTILLWVSYFPYLPAHPFHSNEYYVEGIKKLELGYEKDEKKIEIFKNSLRFEWCKQFLLIFIGITSGFLLVLKKKIGRSLLLILTLYVLSQKIYFQVQSFSSMEVFIKKYSAMLKYMPLHVLHIDIISNLILLVTLVYLVSPSVSKKLMNMKRS